MANSHISHPELQVAVLRGREVISAHTLPVASPAPEGAGLLGLFRRAATDLRPAFCIGRAADADADVEPEAIGGRASFPLISRDAEGRAILHLVPGMRGELTIGVCSIDLDRLARDPAMRQPDGSSRYALPNGTRVQLECGELRFAIAYGGPPLFTRTHAAAAPAQLAATATT